MNTGVVRNYNKADVDLRDVNWELDSGKSVSQLWNVFKNHIEAAIHRHVPVKKLNAGKQKKVLWMTTT